MVSYFRDLELKKFKGKSDAFLRLINLSPSQNSIDKSPKFEPNDLFIKTARAKMHKILFEGKSVGRLSPLIPDAGCQIP